MKAIGNEIRALIAPFETTSAVTTVLRKWCKERGYEYVGAGVARVVIKVGDKVIKVARLGDEGDNLQEALVWRSTEGKAVRRYLGEVVLTHPGGHWLIARYAGKTMQQTMSNYAITYAHARRIASLGLDVEDVHPGNFTTDGICVDYADCLPFKNRA